jgi:hypothetical protein
MEGKKSEVIQRLESYRTANTSGNRSREDFWVLHSLLYPQLAAEKSSPNVKKTVQSDHDGGQRRRESSFLSNSHSQPEYQGKITEIFQKDFEEIYLKHETNEKQIKYFHEVLNCDFNDIQRVHQRMGKRK